MSIEGYSFGVTFFDVVGSAGNAAVYFMREAAAGDARHVQKLAIFSGFCGKNDMQVKWLDL